MLPVANPKDVFAFTRKKGDNKLVVAFNFSDRQGSLQLSEINDRYTEYFSQEKRFLNSQYGDYACALGIPRLDATLTGKKFGESFTKAPVLAEQSQIVSFDSMLGGCYSKGRDLLHYRYICRVGHAQHF
jgi:hypothetical protein